MFTPEWPTEPVAATADFQWSHSNCRTCKELNMTAAQARAHYLIWGHFVVVQIGAEYGTRGYAITHPVPAHDTRRYAVTRGVNILDFRGETHVFQRVSALPTPGKSMKIETDRGVFYTSVFPGLEFEEVDNA